jgi:predicted nucleic acid-binding protein
MSLAPSNVDAYRVVDASVSLKWALDDEDAISEAAALRDEAIRGQFEMVAPSLWLYEVVNGLVTAARRGRVTQDAGRQALVHMLEISVRLADPEARDVYQTALRYGIAAYDAAYLALAEALRAPLWTGDRRLYEAVSPSTSFVRWIGDYDSTN